MVILHRIKTRAQDDIRRRYAAGEPIPPGLVEVTWHYSEVDATREDEHEIMSLRGFAQWYALAREQGNLDDEGRYWFLKRLEFCSSRRAVARWTVRPLYPDALTP
mgnify:CR=1 FL=1